MESIKSNGQIFSKKQQIQWSPKAAHLLLQIRVMVLNRELQSIFRRWYPDFQIENSIFPLEDVA